MVEFLIEVFASSWRLLKAELPDCVAILSDLQSGRRSIAKQPKGYLWICNLTGIASLTRVAGVAWFSIGLGTLVLHLRIHWPPFEFPPDDGHFLWWNLSLHNQPSFQLHYCEALAVVAMTMFIATALSYYGVARLSRELVGVVCPTCDPIQRPKPARRRRQNEVA